MRYYIDLNCDMGEGIGNDSGLIEYISTCSIACGGHYGNRLSIEESIRLAQIYQKNLGPHPSYADKEHFGRKSMKLSPEEFKDMLREQFSLFFGIAKELNAPVHHIKAHGALYNDMFHNQELCEHFLDTVNEYVDHCNIFCQPGSQLGKIAYGRDFEVIYEGFADRRYMADGSLSSRSLPNAVITDVNELCQQVLNMVKNKQVFSIENSLVNLNIQTICLHGDNPKALQFAINLKRFLKENNIEIV